MCESSMTIRALCILNIARCWMKYDSCRCHCEQQTFQTSQISSGMLPRGILSTALLSIDIMLENHKNHQNKIDDSCTTLLVQVSTFHGCSTTGQNVFVPSWLHVYEQVIKGVLRYYNERQETILMNEAREEARIKKMGWPWAFPQIFQLLNQNPLPQRRILMGPQPTPSILFISISMTPLIQILETWRGVKYCSWRIGH